MRERQITRLTTVLQKRKGDTNLAKTLPTKIPAGIEKNTIPIAMLKSTFK